MGFFSDLAKSISNYALSMAENVEKQKLEMHRKADAGDEKAAWVLARFYRQRNPSLSKDYLMQAAQGGHPFAKQVLAGKRSLND